MVDRRNQMQNHVWQRKESFFLRQDVFVVNSAQLKICIAAPLCCHVQPKPIIPTLSLAADKIATLSKQSAELRHLVMDIHFCCLHKKLIIKFILLQTSVMSGIHHAFKRLTIMTYNLSLCFLIFISVGIVVNIIILSARGLGFDPWPCRQASVWDVLDHCICRARPSKPMK